jgi:hypothetical protein
MSYTGTVVVIPTRNRAAIATNAIRSVLNQPADHFAVLVSDNSTAERERVALAEFCAQQSDSRLRYVRPPEALSMPAHWDWAIHEALRSYAASHFLYLTDRMMFRKGALSEVLNLAARFPAKVITYNQDRIVDNVTPIRVEQYPCTGKVLEVDSPRFTWLLSQAVFHPGVPRMNNSVVPRAVLRRIEERFGNVFSSISPDFNFCCRCLELEESILFYDKSPIFHYALSRSNGASVTRGEMTPDYQDFMANLPAANAIWSAAPIPELNTAVNAVFHEYCLFQQQTGSDRFFPVDKEKYLQANAAEIEEIIDPQLKAEMLTLLVKNGYRPAATSADANGTPVALGQRFKSKLKRTATAAPTTSAWLFAARNLGVRPPGDNQFDFAKLDDAIDYAQNISSGSVTTSRAYEEVLQPREIPKQ